jgi:rod shape-determining protein MreC
MIKFLRRIVIEYKEYLLLIILSVISLTIISSSEKPQIKKVRTFAFGAFAIVDESLNSVLSIFHTDYSRDELIRQNAELMLENNRLRKLGFENSELHSMIAFKDTCRYPLIFTDVVSKLANKISGNFIINRGWADGICIGMPVLTHRGLAGIISEVAENYSVVKTLYNSALNIAVRIQGINIEGILSWDGNELVIKNIPTTYDVKVGDIVETSDFSTAFPPSIPIGVISKKEKITLGLLHNISVKPYTDIYAVHDLFVMKIVPSKQINELEMNLMK